jgi:hypothetical protein
MGHLTRAFGQDWYRLNAAERADRAFAEVLPDWVDPRPLSFTQPPPRQPPPVDHWIFGFKRGKMLEHWDKGLFLDRDKAEFVTCEEFERRHPGIIARTAPDADEPARRARIRRERREHKIWRAIFRRFNTPPWEREGVSRATWYRRRGKASKPESGGEPR